MKRLVALPAAMGLSCSLGWDGINSKAFAISKARVHRRNPQRRFVKMPTLVIPLSDPAPTNRNPLRNLRDRNPKSLQNTRLHIAAGRGSPGTAALLWALGSTGKRREARQGLKGRDEKFNEWSEQPDERTEWVERMEHTERTE